MPQPPTAPAGPTRFLSVVFGIVFGGVGLSGIGFLWGTRGFGEPPLFFKLFGSFVALAFVAVGGNAIFAAFKGAASPPANTPSAPLGVALDGNTGYKCPACAARLGEGADVSPKGDVKCGYCKQWFNIHG